MTDHLLARVSDALEASNYYFLMANTDDGSKKEIPAPTPIPRPGEPEPEEKKPARDFASGEEVAAFFTKFSNL
ncbi:hypothetical protein [Streptomyces sp. NPDC002644]